MKKSILVLCFIFSIIDLSAQSAFKKSLSEVTSDVASKLSLKGKKKVVVLFVTDINKAPSVAGKFIADYVSVEIVNNEGNFQVFDRENLNSITEAKKLMAEGYIDAEKTMELGKLLSVEAIIVGNYTVLSSSLSLTLKALDVNSGFVIAAGMKDLPLDNDAGALLGINVSSNGANNNSNVNADNRGYNRPLNSNENYNNPSTVNKECEQKNTGDYCFTNSTNAMLSLSLTNYTHYSMTLSPGQTQCFYNVPAKTADYEYREVTNGVNVRGRVELYGNGQVMVEKCKSKTFVIK